MEGSSPILLGFLGSLAAGMLTSVGAVPVLFGRTPSRPFRDMSLGFAAGVMLAASFFSLIIPALDAAEEIYGSGAVPAAIACAAILLGMATVALMNEKLPHEHFQGGREGPDSGSLRRVWLFVFAITIHNFPEGLAVGGRKPELLARAAALIVDRLSVAERRRAERRKAERRRPEVMWSRVYNALLADMLAKNQARAFKNLLPHRIEDNDLEWWE